MKEIAIYGKGGIGKSTLAANISAALADAGNRVLQIGCDPKHDSTRLVMRGEKLRTVLDYIKDTPVLDHRLSDVLGTGYGDIGCIEAGGPKPGVGCAGRGIITAFEFLERFNVKQDYDTIIYDVLGDVVCGGFAVPIRREYADTVFIVTSGEFMSIYAANNILRGIKNYDTGKGRVAGILYNSRDVDGEDERVERFAEAVSLPVFAKIPRSDSFTVAEREQKTLIELSNDPSLASVFRSIAERINSSPKLYDARPLSDDELEELIMGSGSTAAKYQSEPGDPGDSGSPDASGASAPYAAINGPSTSAAGPDEADSTGSDGSAPSGAHDDMLSKNVIRNEPLHGCAFNGAVGMSVHITDAIVLMHAPKSCAYLSYQTISSTGRRALYERGAILPNSLMPNLESTDMTESDMVFGGTDKLIEKVRSLVSRKEGKPRAVIVISSCPAGIIGDDIDEVRRLSIPECPVITIKADGNLTGDYLQGMLMTYTELAKQIIGPNVRPRPDTVNIVFEKVVLKNAESNFRIIKGFLDSFGIKVNCRYLYDTDFDAVRDFCSASLNLLAYKDYTREKLASFFEKEYGAVFFDKQFPVGYRETEEWLLGITDYFDKRDAAGHFDKRRIAEGIIKDKRAEYQQRIEKARPKLKGKKLLIVTFNHELDWILGAALDAGVEILKICVLNFSQDEGFRTSIPEVRDIPTELDYDRDDRQKDIDRLEPDIVLGNYSTDEVHGDIIYDTIPMCPDVGFFSGIDLIERWVDLADSDDDGEWQNDKRLFEKYYA